MTNKNDRSTILIVDDNLQNLNVLGSHLEKAEYEVAVSTNGKDALDYLKEELVDLILLDIMMPKMNGYEVCIKLKENEITKNIPVIFLTAMGDAEDIVKGFEAGGVDFITKPYHAAELLMRVSTHIELYKARNEIKALQGIIPICSHCKKIRDDEGFWSQVESYISKRTDTHFSHSVCPDCSEKYYGDILKK